jgi:hypothetical protein
MALRAQQTSYFSMHRWIYSFYTDGAYDRAGAGDGEIEQPFRVRARRLWPGLPSEFDQRTVDVFVLSPSSPAERGRYRGSEPLLDAVSALDTLKELAPDEVDAAFWVGARLAESYLPELCGAAGIDCRPVLLPEAPAIPRCPAVRLRPAAPEADQCARRETRPCARACRFCTVRA